MTAPGSREQAEEVQLIVGIQADAPVFQEGQQIFHRLLTFLRATELHHGPFQVLDADVCHVQRLDACGRVGQPVTVSCKMTWDELTALLSKLAQQHDTELKVVPIQGLEAVFLHFVPVAWFSSMKFAGALNIGVYQGDENRLVGTEQIPLAELTPEFVHQRVKKAAAEQFSRLLDPEAIRDFLERFPRPELRDMEGAG